MNILNFIIVDCAIKLNPAGFHINKNAPNTYQDLCKFKTDHLSLPIYNGNIDDSIYDDGYVNVCGRAFHDRMHLHNDYDFSFKGECLTWVAQSKYILKNYNHLFSLTELMAVIYILYIEIVVQAIYLFKTGSFVENQKEFTLNLTE